MNYGYFDIVYRAVFSAPLAEARSQNEWVVCLLHISNNGGGIEKERGRKNDQCEAFLSVSHLLPSLLVS